MTTKDRLERQNLAFEGDDSGALKESATDAVKLRGEKLSKKLKSDNQLVFQVLFIFHKKHD